ncbi:MAG: hypothetical protein JWQ45_310 [Blastococcus sp.]|nr:hypothetical protein [Blastococcus sp.]
MTCRPAVRLLLGIALAVPLVSCGAGPGPLDVAAESSSAQEETSSAPPEVSSAPPTSAATSEAPAEARSEAGTESSGTAPEGTGSEETPATAPEPQPAPPPPPAPEPQPAPEPEPAEEGPGRPGAPYDIEAFDVEGGELSALDAIFRDRCGGKGDSTCLALDESPLVPEGPDRSVCTVDTLAFRPAAADPDGDGVENLQRGTTVVVTTECSGLEDGSGESP